MKSLIVGWRRRLFVLGTIALGLWPSLSVFAGATVDRAGVPVERRLSGDVVEAVYTVVTGPGAHDRIRIHHVHRRDDVYRGSSSAQSIFLLHGDAWGFEAAFLGSADKAAHSLPVYLARRGIDVWGIDLAWTLVSAETADLSFMAGWGVQHDLDDISAGLMFARDRREQQGHGRAGMALLGWSRGGQLGYALLNQEAKRAPHHRHVTAFIAADIFFKTDDNRARAYACADADFYRSALTQGVFGQDNQFFQWVGALSQSDPDTESPLFGPPYTNRSASLTLGAALFQFGPSFTTWYHYVAGAFPHSDVTAIPTGLSFTDIERWDTFLMAVGRYEPSRMLAEASDIMCDAAPSAFDDRLRAITVPVLYVGAAGGFGTSGLYSLGLLGSRDVSHHVVRLKPVGQETLDFAHVDMWHARNADELLWARIYRWLHGLEQRR